MPTRREMLKAVVNGSALVSLSPTVPAFLARSARAAAPDRDGRVLVVIQLDGGNDAINTLVPFADEGYARNRKVLRLSEKNLIKVNDRVGLHPAFREMGKLLERGHLALVPGVGYPNPNRSHFESMAIWQTARLDPDELNGPGWIGRGFDSESAKGRSQSRRRRGPFYRRGDSSHSLARPTQQCVVPGSNRRHDPALWLVTLPDADRTHERTGGR